MSMFSGALQLTNLDDYITPSQECIKPVVKAEPLKSRTGAKITIQDDGSYHELEENGYTQKLEKVEISLTDCLACSGCITSAESVLITQQSQEELTRVFRQHLQLKKDDTIEPNKLIIVSLSVQPVLSLAVRYNLSPNECASKLCSYFKKLGADMVVDMAIADDFALLELQKEFKTRFEAMKNNGNSKSFPMFTSSCPGWVCYAEKSHGSYILPYIATTKSPQQIMGSLIKQYVGKNKQIYHVTLMPCYDKKLEASRNDFFNNDIGSREVDCVITSIELEQMLQRDAVLLPNLENSSLDQPWLLDEDNSMQPFLKKHEGSGSGGYADHVFTYAANKLFNEDIKNIEYKNLRNPDFKEVTLEKDGDVLLRFAIANGFKNIQNLVQKLKRGKSPYHFVEVMACPSGCLNGGAQIRSTEGVSTKDLSNTLNTLYKSLPITYPEENKIVKKLYESWLGGEDSDLCSSIMHTQYHAVEKISNALNIKW